MDEKDLKPLYERDYNLPQDTYICLATGQVCDRVSKHFREYRAFIERLSETNDDRVFLHSEPNLCVDLHRLDRCPIFDLFYKKNR